MKSNGSQEGAHTNMWLKALRCALIAVVLSIALTAAFAFVLTKQWLGVESIGAVNIAIKLVCALLAALLTVRKCQSRAWLRGAISGGMYVILTFMVFSLLSGDMDLGSGLILDAAMCMLCGAVVGIIKNLRS